MFPNFVDAAKLTAERACSVEGKKKTRSKNIVWTIFGMIFKNIFFMWFFRKCPTLALINTNVVLIRAKVGHFRKNHMKKTFLKISPFFFIDNIFDLVSFFCPPHCMLSAQSILQHQRSSGTHFNSHSKVVYFEQKSSKMWIEPRIWLRPYWVQSCSLVICSIISPQGRVRNILNTVCQLSTTTKIFANATPRTNWHKNPETNPNNLVHLSNVVYGSTKAYSDLLGVTGWKSDQPILSMGSPCFGAIWDPSEIQSWKWYETQISLPPLFGASENKRGESKD